MPKFFCTYTYCKYFKLNHLINTWLFLISLAGGYFRFDSDDMWCSRSISDGRWLPNFFFSDATWCLDVSSDTNVMLHFSLQSTILHIGLQNFREKHDTKSQIRVTPFRIAQFMLRKIIIFNLYCERHGHCI